ncbi:diaminopimelate decarboxylase, partial [gut metagenome]
EAELDLINENRGQKGLRAPISIRCNPDVDAKTHPYISTGLKNNKFGIPIGRVKELYCRAAKMPGIEIKGIDAHIGSQITETAPYLDSVAKLLDVMAALREKGLELQHLDIGGGLGIRYSTDDRPPSPHTLLTAVRRLMAERGFEKNTLIVEPGRSIIGNAGVMLTKVLFIKKGERRDFCIVDAAMTDLIRPALYSAWMRIEPVVLRQQIERHTMDVVGPVCESSDFLGHARDLAVLPGDYLAIMDAGAYGASMASRYNSRLLPMEYLVDGSQLIPLRRPDTFETMIEDDLLL